MSIEKSEKFLKAMKVIFKNEGGYSDHPNDKGGKTNLGITTATLKSAVANKITNITDVRELTRDVAENIYFQMYWTPSKAEIMKSPIDLIQFDVAVNSGVKNANKLLQRAINKCLNTNILVVDGIIGKNTLKYLDKVSTTNEQAIKFSHVFLDIRAVFYDEIIARNPSQKVFRNGWMNRIKNLRTIIQNGY